MIIFSADVTGSYLANVSGNSDWSNVIASFGQFFFTIIVIIIVLYLAYLATKFFARSRLPGKGSNFEIIDSLPLGQQSMMTIVKAGGKYLLVGVTKESVSLLAELDGEDIKRKEGTAVIAPFEKYLGKLLKKPEARDEANDKKDGGE